MAYEYQNPLNGILTSLLGGETDATISEAGQQQGTNTQQSNATVNQNQTNTQSGSTSTSTAGTSAATGSQTSTGTQIQQSLADVSKLEQVFAKQSAGITPEMLAAIFTQGSKAVPGLVNATANAVGARASGNSPLATALTQLNADLTDKAAVLNTQLLKDSGDTAAKIAELTKQMSTTSSETGSTQQNVATSQQEAITQLLTNILSGTTDTVGQQVNTTNQQTGSVKDIEQTNTINTDVLKVLAGLGLGGSVLNGILPGGIGSIIPGIVGGVKDIGGGIFDWLQGLGGSGGDVFDVGLTDGAVDLGEWLDIGWKDGGKIPKKGIKGYADGGKVEGKSEEAPKAAMVSPQQAQMLQLLQFLLYSQQAALGKTKPAKSGAAPEKSDDANDSGQALGNVAATPESNNAAISAIGQGLVGMALGPLGPAATAIGNALGISQGPIGTIGGLMAAGQMAQTQADTNTLGVGLSTGIGNVGSVAGGFGDAPAGFGFGGFGIGEGDGTSGGVSVGLSGLGEAADGIGGGDGSSSGGDGGNSGPGGGSDGSDGGDGPGGWNDGGKMPEQSGDPKGIRDTVTIKVSGGEEIIPADAADALGPEFFEYIRMNYHTPASLQEMGIK